MTPKRPILPGSHKELRTSVSNTDSLNPIYASILPFALGEYFIEQAWIWSPSGIMFPLGFVLFWTFYFIYFRSMMVNHGFEKHSHFNIGTFFAILAGVILWFARSTFGEILKIFWEGSQKSHYKNLPPPSRNTPPPSFSDLPLDAIHSLRILGLSENSDWNTIHRRYRDLAKKFHPDLHPDLTNPGLKFRQIDTAYRRLEWYKHLF